MVAPFMLNEFWDISHVVIPCGALSPSVTKASGKSVQEDKGPGACKKALELGNLCLSLGSRTILFCDPGEIRAHMTSQPSPPGLPNICSVFIFATLLPHLLASLRIPKHQATSGSGSLLLST